jgi:uncharacterized protein (TIGR00730 family)
LKRVCVYCGSHPGNDPAHTGAVEELARALVERGIGVVFGGGQVGLMGTLADTALAAGGEVIGIIPRALDRREVSHKGVTELHVVESMHERKAMMAELSDAFIAATGGIGTLEELIEIYTWSQLGIHRKPVALYDVNGYWDHLAAWLDRAVEEGFLPVSTREMLFTDADPRQLLDRLQEWISRQQ